MSNKIITRIVNKITLVEGQQIQAQDALDDIKDKMDAGIFYHIRYEIEKFCDKKIQYHRTKLVAIEEYKSDKMMFDDELGEKEMTDKKKIFYFESDLGAGLRAEYTADDVRKRLKDVHVSVVREATKADINHIKAFNGFIPDAN